MRSIPARLALCVVLAGTALTAACAPIIARQGYQAVTAVPAEVKVGEDRNAVRARLGTPTVASTFEPNIWYYMTQESDRVGFSEPRVRTRQVVAITFDKQTQKVAAIQTFTEKDGRVIAFNDRQTPTRGREMSVVEQLLGNIGATTMLPPMEDDPGQLPGR